MFANVLDLYQLMGDSESAHWPLQAGYPGLSIKNLNDYVSLFSHCLVNIENYQGIEIIGIKSPVYITRFDFANLEYCIYRSESNLTSKRTHRFLFGKIPPKSEQNCSTDYDQVIKYDDKSFKSRWYCTAQFDLFFPEPAEAPHFFGQSDYKNNLFDMSLEYFTTLNEQREDWSKML